MGITAVHSSIPDVKNAVQEIKSQLKDQSPELVVFFASPKLSPQLVASEIHAAFPGSQSIGCSTAGEIVSGSMLKGSIVAMAFEHEMDDFQIEIVENISTKNESTSIIKKLESHFNQTLLSMDPQKYVGLILIDGLSKAEERIMDQIGNLSSITFVGGSAGDDLAFDETYIYANGKAYTNAAVLAVLKPSKGFDLIKTQSFSNMGIELEATKVQEADRKVIEFNHQPAVNAYAAALGIPPDKVPNHFMEHPLGLMLGEEPYVRSPQRVEKNNMVFYCSIIQGMKLSVLQSKDLIKDTEKVLQEKEAQLGKIRGILNFNCILRALELENKQLTGAYGKLFTHIPTIGFNTYGEEYIGHINQTATMLVFK